MAGKKGGLLGRRKRVVNLPKAQGVFGTPDAELTPEARFEKLATMNFSLEEDLDGETLEEKRQREINERLMALLEAMSRGDAAAFYDDYSDYFDDEDDAEQFYEMFQASLSEAGGRELFSSRARGMRDWNLTVFDSQLESIALARRAMDISGITQAYGYKSCAEAAELLRTAGERIPGGQELTLDGLYDHGSTPLSAMDVRTRSEYISLITQDYMHSVGLPEDKLLEAALYTSPVWGCPGNVGARIRELPLIDAKIAEMSHVADTYTDEQFLAAYGDKFDTPDIAVNYFNNVLRGDNGQDAGFDAFRFVEEFRTMDHVRSFNATDMGYAADCSMTAKCFDIPQIYGYASYDEVTTVLNAARELGMGGYAGREFVTSLDAIDVYDVERVAEDPFFEYNIEDVRSVKDYANSRQIGLAPAGVDSAVVMRLSSQHDARYDRARELDAEMAEAARSIEIAPEFPVSDVVVPEAHASSDPEAVDKKVAEIQAVIGTYDLDRFMAEYGGKFADPAKAETFFNDVLHGEEFGPEFPETFTRGFRDMDHRGVVNRDNPAAGRFYESCRQLSDCFDIAQMYGYADYADVQRVQKAAAELRIGDMREGEFVTSLNMIDMRRMRMASGSYDDYTAAEWSVVDYADARMMGQPVQVSDFLTAEKLAGQHDDRISRIDALMQEFDEATRAAVEGLEDSGKGLSLEEAIDAKVAEIRNVASTYDLERFMSEYGGKFDDPAKAEEYFNGVMKGDKFGGVDVAATTVPMFRHIDMRENSDFYESLKTTMDCFDVPQLYGYAHCAELERLHKAAFEMRVGRWDGDTFITSLDMIEKYELSIGDYNTEDIGGRSSAERVAGINALKGYAKSRADGTDLSYDDVKTVLGLCAEYDAKIASAEPAPSASGEPGPEEESDIIIQDDDAGDNTPVSGDIHNTVMSNILDSARHGFEDNPEGESEGQEEQQEQEPQGPRRRRRNLGRDDQRQGTQPPPRNVKVPKGTNMQGSKSEAEYLDDLMEQISSCKHDFVTYSDDMLRWENPSDIQLQIDRRNKAFYHNMIDTCMRPLQNGVSAGNILDSIGMYAGMCIMSKEFRKYTKSKVATAMFPVVETAVKSKDRFCDAIVKPLQRGVDWTERKTGHKVPFVGDKIKQYEFKSDTSNERLRAKREYYLANLNNGRVPLTPETLALNYVAFTRQAYEQMHSPDCDTEDKRNQINERLGKAMTTLFKLGEMDGINADDANENIRTLVGTMTTLHPEMRSMFYETAGFKVERGRGKEVEFNDGSKGTIWHGEYIDKTKSKDGQVVAFKDAFNIRWPDSADAHVRKISVYMGELLKDVDDPNVVMRLGESELCDDIRDHFTKMVQDDMQVPYLEKSYKKICYQCARMRLDTEQRMLDPGVATLTSKERNARIDEIVKTITPEQAVWELGIYKAGEAWFKAHPGAEVELQVDDVEVRTEPLSEAERMAEVQTGDTGVEYSSDETAVDAVIESVGIPVVEAEDAFNFMDGFGGGEVVMPDVSTLGEVDESGGGAPPPEAESVAEPEPEEESIIIDADEYVPPVDLSQVPEDVSGGGYDGGGSRELGPEFDGFGDVIEDDSFFYG